MPWSSSASLGKASAWIVAAVSVLVVGLSGVPVASAADTCDNAALREQNDSNELPDCRAYEMVSPSYKEGFDLDPRSFTDDGFVWYDSTGNFVDNGLGMLSNAYLAVRTPGGWEPQSMMPPGASYSLDFELSPVPASDLRSVVWPLNPRDQSGDGRGFYVRDLGGGFTRVGQGPSPVAGPLAVSYASNDLSHVVFGPWEYVGVGAAAVVRRVSVDNTGTPIPNAPCGGGISGDGRVVVFGAECQDNGVMQVRARVGGETTVAVSGSECTRVFTDPGGLCNGISTAAYVGMANDGSRVFFTTDQQLVNADRDLTRDLYACDISDGSPAPVGDANPCETLTEVSGASDAARLENVVAVSEDGSRVYFLAQGVLAANLGTSGAGAVAGGQNLYVWTKDAAHPAGQTKFVAGLDGSGVGGGAQTVMGGRYLVFSTKARLVSSGPGDDDDGGAADMYRYDAESDTMLRLSTSVMGSGGNAPGFDVISNEFPLQRAAYGVSADGSMVVFETAEALSPDDTDGVTDVYLWRGGRVSLISRGGGERAWISSTGQDIYFVTSQRLTAADGDVNTDLYNARIGGGFDLTLPAACSGDGCQGQQSGVPALAEPSAGGSGDDGASGSAAVVSLRAVSAAQRRRLAATGKLNLAISANTAGVLRVRATAKIAGRTSTVASGRRAIARPGTARVALTLSKKARKQLGARGRLAVRIVVSHSKATRSRSVTLRLAHAKAKGGRS